MGNPSLSTHPLSCLEYVEITRKIYNLTIEDMNKPKLNQTFFMCLKKNKKQKKKTQQTSESFHDIAQTESWVYSMLNL